MMTSLLKKSVLSLVLPALLLFVALRLRPPPRPAPSNDMSDPSCSSNFRDVVVTHLDWQVETDFSAKELHCAATLKAKTKKDGVAKLILDIHELKVNAVLNAGNGQELQFEVQGPEGVFGSTLHITLPSSCAAKGSEVAVIVQYSTSPSCSAVQWLEPAQTAGKQHPYLFTQCQPIHARSMLPCQDTPAVKTTFTAEVTVPVDLTALMGGERLGSEPHPKDSSKKVVRFQQKVPIPSYLIALVVGALESRRIGPRSHVWSEKEMVDQAAWEFEETEKMLQAAEEMVGVYLWGHYDLLVLPPSFPYGGMENPTLTFVSPTTIVVAHEISHSWTGNLVTNINWEHFWLNEGITTYLERKIIAKLHGEKERHLHAINGWSRLKNTIEDFERDDRLPLTALVPTLTGVHPDDAYSIVPYEKGSIFMFYLETLLGGPSSLDDFLKAYVQKFKYITVTTDEWKEFFLNYFYKEAHEGLFEQVEWDKWLYSPGMPPFTPNFDTSLADASAALADRWAHVGVSEEALSQFSSSDFDGMTSLGIQEFLNQLFAKSALSIEVLKAMDAAYNFNKKENSEIKFRWLRLCLKSKWKAAFPLVVDFVTKQGRMKFVRPLYKDLFACDEGLALLTFKNNRQFYHGVAAGLIAKDIGLNQ